MNRLTIMFIMTFFIGCSQERNDLRLPSPRWVEKSLPTDLEERGIDAHNINLQNPTQNSIKLMWYLDSENDIQQYKVFRSDVTDEQNTPIEFSNVFISETDTFYIDETPNVYLNYFYYLTTRSFEGVESHPSDTITYQLLKKPLAVPTFESEFSTQLKFQWIDDQNTSHITSYYLIKIENEWGQGQWSCLFLNPNFLNDGELVSFEYPINGFGCIDHQGINELLNPGKYYWKIKALRLGNGITTSNDHDVAGAESNWVELNIVESGKLH